MDRALICQHCRTIVGEIIGDWLVFRTKHHGEFHETKIPIASLKGTGKQDIPANTPRN